MHLLRRFRTKTLQTFLTLVQVVLGSFAMTLALSAYMTPEDGLGEDLFYLSTGSQDPDGSSSSYDLFSTDDLEELLTLTDDVEAVAIAADTWESELIYNGQRYRFLNGLNATPNYFSLADVEVTRGSAFSQADADKEEAVVLLSESAAKAIFEDIDPVGQEVMAVNVSPSSGTQLSSTRYRVAGLIEDPAVVSSYGTPGVVFPVWAKGGVSYGGSGFATLLVKAKPGQGEVAQAQMLSAVRRFYQGNEMVQDNPEGRDFFIVTPFEPAGANSIFIILGLFGVVALIVSSVGLFSNTLIEVTRRTHEIGLNRALGATGVQVGRQFSLEAALLSLVGSVLGAAFAGLMMPVLTGPLAQTYLYGTKQLLWQPEAALIVILVAVALGAVLSFIPALRAGRMKPIEALKVA